MNEADFLGDIVIILLVAVVVVAALRRIGVPTIAGLVLTGVLIGPRAIGLVDDLEEVRVLMAAGSDKPDKQDDKHGRLIWNLSLKPGEKKTVRFRYTVVVPKDLQWNPFQAGINNKGISAAESVFPVRR